MACSGSHHPVSVAGTPAGEGVCSRAEGSAGSQCREDYPQHLAWGVGSDDLEGMAATSMTQPTLLSWLQVTNPSR